MPTKDLTSWDFNNNHVQAELEGTEYISAASTLIAAGPPAIKYAGNIDATAGSKTSAKRDELNSFAYPVGVLDTVGLQQNRNLQRLFEIGSKRSYFIPGRNVISANMGRVMFHGPSLLRMLYAYYPSDKINATVGELLADGAGRLKNSAPTVRSNPGFADGFFNLDSDLFDHPFGFLILMHDAGDIPYAAVYAENAYVQNHQVTWNSASIVMAEGTGMQMDRVLPVDVGATSRAVKLGASLEEQASA